MEVNIVDLAIALPILYTGLCIGEGFAEHLKPLIRKGGNNMRRHTIILALVALLALTGVATAQDYPENLAGFEFTGDAGERLFVPWEQYDVPYSFPLDQDLVWLIDIEALDSDYPRLLVTPKCLAHPPHGCISTPVGGPVPEVYAWEYELSAYAHLETLDNGDQLIDCYSWKADGWWHYVGKLDLWPHPPYEYNWGWYYAEHVPIALPTVENYEPGPLATD